MCWAIILLTFGGLCDSLGELPGSGFWRSDAWFKHFGPASGAKGFRV